MNDQETIHTFALVSGMISAACLWVKREYVFKLQLAKWYSWLNMRHRSL